MNDNSYFGKRVVPENDLEFQRELVNPVFGTDNVHKNFREGLKKKLYVKNEKTGELQEISGDDYWANASFLTRDWGLSNFSKTDMFEVRKYLNIANACNNLLKMPKATSSAIIKAGIISQTGLGYQGAQRKWLNSFRHESITQVSNTKKDVLNKKSND